MTDEIRVQEYERRQLCEFLPDVIDHYRATDLDDRADALETTLSIFEDAEDDDRDEQTYELPDDGWDLVVRGLESLDDTRAAWLRAKLARRNDMQAVRMGFTSDVPLMAIRTGTQPSKPE